METILDWQQRGIIARVLDLSACENPSLKYRPARGERTFDEWQQKVEAWLFGWSIEDAMRN
ncbi:CrpP-related protein [Rhizobium halophilum]|uniref:CrpP-related protein n=1 Tax=Rhizobium halophilum TaxID=2846852 RepID=UPI001EFDB0A1|nr:CrpP-related protein [Rhizobium halophilum]MCF6370692.1 hypothetical protein [Rhizobium halophilum]